MPLPHFRLFAVVLLAAALAGCAHARPDQPAPLAIPAYPMAATDHPTFLANAAPAPAVTAAQRPEWGSYDDRKLAQPPQCARPELAGATAPIGPTRYLVLSGGSQNGAFGAGFFLGLKESGQMPTEPTVVTGISTGALQSTFLFLANQDLPGDRDYGWAGGPGTDANAADDPRRGAVRPGRSNVEDLVVAYAIRKEGNILHRTSAGGLGMLLKGSKGDLSPLRNRLLGLISPQTVRAVAFEACRGRKLMVGVADVDDGQAYALDLTQLALLAFDGSMAENRMTMVRKGFVEALLASSSVPVGAKPITLRIRDRANEQHKRHLFVDGGARFGVFLQDLDEARRSLGQANDHDGVTLIVNTPLTIGRWRDDDDPLNPAGGWTLTSLGLRTVGLLENQVYRLSVEAIEARAKTLGGLHMAFISNDHLPGAELPADHLWRGKTCAAWKQSDAIAFRPMEFSTNYMGCLTDYGRQRGQAYQWNLVE